MWDYIFAETMLMGDDDGIQGVGGSNGGGERRVESPSAESCIKSNARYLQSFLYCMNYKEVLVPPTTDRHSINIPSTYTIVHYMLHVIRWQFKSNLWIYKINCVRLQQKLSLKDSAFELIICN